MSVLLAVLITLTDARPAGRGGGVLAIMVVGAATETLCNQDTNTSGNEISSYSQDTGYGQVRRWIKSL